MRRRKRKAVEEIGKPLKKIFSDFSEIGKPLKSNFEQGKLDFGLGKSRFSQRHSQVSGDFGVSFLTPDLLPRARMDLLNWFQLLIT